MTYIYKITGLECIPHGDIHHFAIASSVKVAKKYCLDKFGIKEHKWVNDYNNDLQANLKKENLLITISKEILL